MQIVPYLNFNGQCRAAFKFYEQCLGGKIVAMFTYGETPAAEHVSAESGDRIMHARLVVGGVAARPLRLVDVETAIRGRARSEETARMAAEIASRGAVTLRHNAYKVPLMENLVKRAIRGEGEWTS